eukprot:1574220-Pleurochrysis_carterae.AAC.1
MQRRKKDHTTAPLEADPHASPAPIRSPALVPCLRQQLPPLLPRLAPSPFKPTSPAPHDAPPSDFSVEWLSGKDLLSSEAPLAKS